MWINDPKMIEAGSRTTTAERERAMRPPAAAMAQHLRDSRPTALKSVSLTAQGGRAH